jgi:uncharacterized protein YjbI with pentapeptide repeats
VLCRAGTKSAPTANLSKTRASLPFANFSNADLTGSTFRAADLRRANMHAIRAEKTDFSMANIEKVKKTDMDLYHAETWKPPPLP